MEVAAIEQQGNERRRVVGRPFPKGVSGNPHGRRALRERIEKLYATMTGDFGPLSATDEVLLRQACLLLARSERVHRRKDLDSAIRMSGEARRLLESLRKHAAPADKVVETFAEIARRAQAEETERRARELAEDDAKDAADAPDDAAAVQTAADVETRTGALPSADEGQAA
jgi:hypothetical protein